MLTLSESSPRPFPGSGTKVRSPLDLPYPYFIRNCMTDLVLRYFFTFDADVALIQLPTPELSSPTLS